LHDYAAARGLQRTQRADETTNQDR